MDDILVTGSSSMLIHKLVESLHAKFSLVKLGSPEYFLGTEIKSLALGNILLIQSKYICDLLAKVNTRNVNGVTTTILSTCKLNINGSSSLYDPFINRSMVCAL